MTRMDRAIPGMRTIGQRFQPVAQWRRLFGEGTRKGTGRGSMRGKAC